MRPVFRRSVLASAALGLWAVSGTRLAATAAQGTPADAPQVPAFAAAAQRIQASQLDASGFPPKAAWSGAPAIAFAHDWQGRPIAGPQSTRVELLNTAHTLFLRFTCRYAELHTFEREGSPSAIYPLWERDVVEVFLQAPGATGLHYREIEVAPNGLRLELEIDGQHKRRLHGASRARTSIDDTTKTWTAEVAIDLSRSTPTPTPEALASTRWRVNFFRVEGRVEPRLYSSWSPTRTAEPSFHEPQAFGTLQLDLSASTLATR